MKLNLIFDLFISIVSASGYTDPELRKFAGGILRDGRIHCMGARIRRDFLITTPNCLQSDAKRYSVVVFNSTDYEVHNATRYASINGMNVPDLKVLFFGNDIKRALTGMTYDDMVEPTAFEDHELRVIGWNHLQGDSTSYQPDALFVSGYRYLKPKECSNHIYDNLKSKIATYNFKELDSEHQICTARYQPRTKNVCHYDEGAPLIVVMGTRVTLLGLFSWSTGCDGKATPALFDKISPYTTDLYDYYPEAVWRGYRDLKPNEEL